MQVAVNLRFVQRRTSYARIGTLGGLGALVAGFIVTFFQEYQMLSWIGMIIGLTAINFGRYNTVRWVTHPRDDEVVALNLRGLDRSHLLLNYMRQTPAAKHILISPHGLYTFEVRRDEGRITNNGSRWSRKPSLGILLRTMVEGGLGNPTADALHEAKDLNRFLIKSLGEAEAANVPIQPLILFVSGRVELNIINPTVPVLVPENVRNYMRKAQRQERLSPEKQAQIQALFGLG